MEGVSRVSVNASSDPAVIKIKWTTQPSSSKVLISVLYLAFFLLVLRRWVSIMVAEINELDVIGVNASSDPATIMDNWTS